MSELATADQLFGTPCPRRFRVIDPLPVKGLRCRIRSLTEREVSEYQSQTVAAKGNGLRKDKLRDASRRLIALCLVDAEGNTFTTPSHVEAIADWDAADAAYLYEECAIHVGIKTADIEDLVKNSEATTVAE